MPSAVEKSKVTSAACNTEKAKKAIKKIEKKRFILHINNLWYKITTKSRHKHKNYPKKVINNRKKMRLLIKSIVWYTMPLFSSGHHRHFPI